MMTMTWHNFWLFALPAVLAWTGGSVCAWLGTRGRQADAATLAGPPAEGRSALTLRRAADALYLLGLVILAVFIAGLWTALERPPFRTTGETRLWYAFFMPLCGFLVYKRYRYAFVLACATLLAAVFIGLNLLKPEIHDQTLMPALQSAWFVPHVMIYMFAYALLGVSFLLACFRLIRGKQDGLRGKKDGLREKEAPAPTDGHPTETNGCRTLDKTVRSTASTLKVEDDLTRIGWICLSIGLFFGAIWAKQAWGNFWTWDPKETWAAATFLCYSLYLHLRLAFPKAESWAQAVQIFGFLLLQMCWYGLNLFPALGQSSIHLYN